MDLKTLREELQNIAVLAGTARHEDFIGLSAVDVAMSYAIGLSGGRLNDEATILGIAQSVQDVRTFINLISRGSIPVPNKDAILEYLDEQDTAKSILAMMDAEMPTDPPAPTAPSEAEIKHHYQRIGHGIRQELLNRRNLNVSEDVERNRLQNLFAGEIFNEFIRRFGTSEYKALRSGVSNINAFRDVIMGAKSAEELMDLLEGKSPKRKKAPEEPMVGPMKTPEKPKASKKPKTTKQTVSQKV